MNASWFVSACDSSRRFFEGVYVSLSFASAEYVALGAQSQSVLSQ